MAIVFRGDPGCLAEHCVAGLKFDLKLNRIEKAGSPETLTHLKTVINSADQSVYLTEVRKLNDVDGHMYSFDLVCMDHEGKTSCFTVESDHNYNVQKVSHGYDVNNLSDESRKAYEEMQEDEAAVTPQLK